MLVNTWAFLDLAYGPFLTCQCGPFYTQLWAVLDIHVGRFGPGLWAVFALRVDCFGPRAVLI